MGITLRESLRGLFYAPFYVALTHELYAAEGVDVRFVAAPETGTAATAILTGEVDVSWGGPMRVMHAYHQDPACDLVSFAEVVTRDPFLLVGRAPRPGFSVRDLSDMRLASVSEVPTPWMCLQEDLRRAGVAPATIERVADRTMAENCTALLEGGVDVVQVFEPFVSTLVNEHGCAVWYAQAGRGPTSYTTFYARRATLTARRDELRRMVRAIHRAQLWVAGATGAAIGDAVRGFFPDVPAAILAAACDRYKAVGIWGRDPILPRAGYDRLLSSLVSGGFVDPGTPFDVAVDNGIAAAVVAEMTPRSSPFGAAVQSGRKKSGLLPRTPHGLGGPSGFRGEPVPKLRRWPDPEASAILRTSTLKEAPMSTFLAQTESMIVTWHGIAAPNDPARRLAAELADTIAAFGKLRGTLAFEDEPASFEAALQATKETAP